jgi:quercetin dioxygenase-like cupin family protein
MMIISHEKDVLGVQMENDQMKGVIKKVLISPAQGWDGYVMRQFQLCEGGYTPKHEHSWPHIVYILKGQGSLLLDGQDYDMSTGSFVFIPGDKAHKFTNTGKEDFKFICIVPEEGDQ